MEWNRITGANGYQVYTSTSVNGEYKKSATIGAGKTKHTLKVANGKTVYIKIRAFRNSNGSKKYSGFSSPKKGTEIGATWYKKVLKTRSKKYTVRYQSSHIVERKKVNRKDYPYYAVTDLDKDGIKELILHTGYDNPYYENRILLMTYKNNKEQPLLSFGRVGFRAHFYLTGKNIAMVTSGSDFSYRVYFKIRDGKLAKVRDLRYWNDKSGIPYKPHFYVNGREVSENAWRQETIKYFPSTLKDMTFKKIA